MDFPTTPHRLGRPAAILTVALVLYTVVFRLIPYDLRAYCLWPFVAFGLYTGVQWGWFRATVLTLSVQFVVDLYFYAVKGWEITLPTYVAFAVWTAVSGPLRRVMNWGRWSAWGGILVAAIMGYAFFFVVTNFGAWCEAALPEYRPATLHTLLLSFRNGLEFLRDRDRLQFPGAVLSTLIVFGIHAVLVKAMAPRTANASWRAR